MTCRHYESVRKYMVCFLRDEPICCYDFGRCQDDDRCPFYESTTKSKD